MRRAVWIWWRTCEGLRPDHDARAACDALLSRRLEFPVARSLQRGRRALQKASIAADIDVRRNYLSSARIHVAKENFPKEADSPMNSVALVLAGGEGTRLYP